MQAGMALPEPLLCLGDLGLQFAVNLFKAVVRGFRLVDRALRLREVQVEVDL